MSASTAAPFSVSSLFADRERKRVQEKEAEEKLARGKEEERETFRTRLENFELKQETIDAVKFRITRAFERGENELLLVSFPSDFCTDSGRAINNAGAPPIVKLTAEEKAKLKDAEPEWLKTLPRGARPIYEYWKTDLRPAGFGFSVRILDFPDGMPGNVGLFFTWPKSSLPEDTAANS